MYVQQPIKLIEKMIEGAASDQIVTGVNNKSMAFSWTSTHMNKEGSKFMVCSNTASRSLGTASTFETQIINSSSSAGQTAFITMPNRGNPSNSRTTYGDAESIRKHDELRVSFIKLYLQDSGG